MTGDVPDEPVEVPDEKGEITLETPSLPDPTARLPAQPGSRLDDFLRFPTVTGPDP